eukprot:TRINITY_DN17011_c0_g1_i1.p1 TRINITY_DN17011_c0_g1~~TRINITY_DN17011_c0_g1_i1.p1  ORF type:complete len:136 (+),score=59.12 TRINITY_DN17011_c0_g1_i1:96-503(+)
MANFLFVMVGKDDIPLYQTGNLVLQREGISHMGQFVVHSSLDVIEELLLKANTMNLKIVDHYEDYNISAFVTAGNVKLVLLHDLKNDESVKAFFLAVNEYYIKILLNPFYEINTPITSPYFGSRVRNAAKRHLKP